MLACSLLFVSLSGAGCHRTTRFTSLDQLAQHLNSDHSPYLRTTVTNGVRVSLKYLPTEAVMLGELRQHLENKQKLKSNGEMREPERTKALNKLESELRDRRESYERHLHFQLTLKYEDPDKNIVQDGLQGAQQNYGLWLQKLTFGLQKQLSLETDILGQIPLELYHMEPTFGVNRNISFMLVFPSQHNGQNVLESNSQLTLKISEFGLNTGPVVFEYLLPLPDLKYEGEV